MVDADGCYGPYLLESGSSKLIRVGFGCREEKIMAIKAREGSPKWLGDEVERIKDGLMKLSHNVVLLRDAENPLVYTPVSPGSQTKAMELMCWK